MSTNNKSLLWLCVMLLVGFVAVPITSGLADEADDVAVAALKQRFTKESHSGASGGTLLYRKAEPASGIPMPESGYPLVVFLHGAGERGSDNEIQLKHGVWEFLRPEREQANPAVVIAPQCPKGKRWVEVNWDAADGKGSSKRGPSETMAMVLELVDELLKRPDVDANRLYLTGLSMGGFGTWHATAAKPGYFAAAMPVCGGGDPLRAASYSGTSIWAIHGGADTVVIPQRSREMVAALAEAGHIGGLHYTEYPGVGHDSWSAAYSDDTHHRWLFEQHLEK